MLMINILVLKIYIKEFSQCFGFSYLFILSCVFLIDRFTSPWIPLGISFLRSCVFVSANYLFMMVIVGHGHQAVEQYDE